MPPNEQTPLVQVVQVAPPRARYSNHTLRRFCTIALAIVLIFTVGIFLLSAALFGGSDLFGDRPTEVPFWRRWPWWRHARPVLPHASWPESNGLPFSELKQIILETPDADTSREWSRYYASGPHLAGKNESQAIWTRDLWQSFGVQSNVVPYDVYINYPKDHGLSLLRNGQTTFRATLEEDVLEEDPTTGLPDRVPTFHGYSASGNVTAQYVYVNYGRYRDYEDLVNAGVDLKGKIALARYGGIFRGLKVKRAQELGMVGCVIFTDPGNDGEITEENGYDTYPKGPARNPSSVERGSVQFLSFAPGDPSTIGYPSKPGVPRGDVNISTPHIPSMPISYAEALPILKALNGHGPNASSFGDRWSGGGLGYKGVHYNIGPSPESVELHLYNEQDYTITPIWNTIGIINGTHQDEVLIVGNHRDAWIAGGAGDPNAGSAILNEVIRSIGIALKKGWKPQRTIVFASWDGEEYGLLGSTEWVEEYIPWLSGSAFAYLNVDGGAAGDYFAASAAPLLDKVLIQATKDVQSPNQTTKGSSVHDIWDKRISTMGSGSDFTAFQDYAGVPCINIGFGPGKDFPIYHYHSNYDSETWMERYGDPTFEYHVTMSRLLGVLSIELLESPLLSFNATDYALALERYLDSVHAALEETSSKVISAAEIHVALQPLRRSIGHLQAQSHNIDEEAAELAECLTAADSDEIARLYHRVRKINRKYQFLERAFLYDKGLDGRNWFKHVVFAPGLWTGYAGATWPGLVEAVQAGDRKALKRWVGVGIDAVHRAVETLKE